MASPSIVSRPAESQPRFRVRARTWWRRYWWIVLLATAVLAFLLAFLGADGGFFKRLNTALNLLPLGFRAPETDVSLPLQVARILAPLVFAYATYKAVFVLLAERLQDVQAGVMKDHTVVCGLGNRGQALVDSLLGSSKVVAVELNPANLAIRRLRDAGAVVLVGDSTDPELLRKAQTERAANLVSVCGDDAANAQVAANVLDLEKHRPAPLSTFVHVGDPRLYTFLLHHSFSSPHIRLEFFNVYERGARLLLDETVAPRDGGAPVLVVGAGQFGLALISQLARERSERLASDPEVGKLHIYLVDREAEKRAALLIDRYSRFRDVCELGILELDVQSPAFDQLLERSQELGRVGIAYVCFDSDSLTIACALNLLDQARGRFPIAARVTRRGEGLAGLIQDTQSRYADPRSFLPVSPAERACRADLVLDGMRGQLAREVHERYRAGNTGTVYDVPWDALSEDGRNRNLTHADAIAGQLETVGYRLGPLLDWGEPTPELTSDEIDRMAVIEHERWVEERLAHGWRYGPERSDDPEVLTHPDLVQWDELSPARREINSRLIRERPAMLARVGIRIHRP